MAEPVLVVAAVVAAALYAAGARTALAAGGHGRVVARRRAWAFGAGLAAVVGALGAPLAGRADERLAAHMAQHVLLLNVAAPLLVVGAAVPTVLSVVPVRLPRRAAPGGRRPVWAAAALVAQSAAMLAWHAPAAYEAALGHEPLHAAEHVTFLATAVAFWTAVGAGPGRRHGWAVPVLFVAALPGTALGAGLTLSLRTWYPSYPSPADQQLAGVMMWAFAGVAYVVAAGALFAAWLAGAERQTPGRAPLAAPDRLGVTGGWTR